jgi:hypothetical protein
VFYFLSKLKSNFYYKNEMSASSTRLTDDDRRKLTYIPDSVETRDLLEDFLFDLFIRDILTDDNLSQIIRN